MQYAPIFFLILIGLVLITRPLTVLFHELGHAIPAILLTKQKVSIYIGSHGDPKKSLKVNLGLLCIFFRYNPFAWRLGLCVPSADSISTNKQIVYTVTGPLMSILIGTIACYFTFAYDLHGFLKLFLIVFLGSSFFDLLVNLIPDQTPHTLYDGRVTYNDGYSLKLLFYYKRLPKEFAEATDLFNEQRFADAAILYEKFLSDRSKDENIYRLAILSHLQGKNYNKAKELSEAFALTGKMDSDDLSNFALSYTQLGLFDEAIELYDKSLQQNPDNKHSLNNKAYTLTLVNRFEESIALFDRAIELDTDFPYSYSNRGLSKIKLGQLENGLHDINRAIELDPNNAYGYRNLGIYHFEKGELDEALQLFVKAKELDDTTHQIDELINDLKHQIDQRTVGNKSVTAGEVEH